VGEDDVFQEDALREVLEEVQKPPNLSELARMSGVSRMTVHSMYHNLTTRVDLATLDAIADALGCAPGELLGKKRGRVR
jgi:DNA-binding Xre family transcriptional regulator